MSDRHDFSWAVGQMRMGEAVRRKQWLHVELWMDGDDLFSRYTNADSREIETMQITIMHVEDAIAHDWELA